MSKKGNYAGLNELTESVFFKPSNQPQNIESSSTPKDTSIEPVNNSISANTPTNEDLPTTLLKEENKSVKTDHPENKNRYNEQTNVSTNERHKKRPKIRHTFDIFADQLISLREITLEREKKFGERVLLGDLAQEALDMLITKERNKD